MHVAWLDHVRYERHADHRDEMSFVDAFAPEATPSLPFSAVEAVRPRGRTVVLRLDHSALESSPLAERRGSGHGHSSCGRFSYLESGESELGVRFQREPMTPLTPAERDALRLRAAKEDEVFSGRTVGELILDVRETRADASAGLLGAALDAILAQCIAEPFEPWPGSFVAALVTP
jgi:hypothetical protein